MAECKATCTVLFSVRLLAVLLISLFILSCSGDGDPGLQVDGDSDTEAQFENDTEYLADGDADSEEEYSGSWVETEVGGNPFAVSFAFEGKKLTSIADDAVSALYIYDVESATRIDLEAESLSRSENSDGLRLEYNTSDARKAVVTLGRGQQGSAMLSFEVENLKASERLCADFRVKESEGFYGLMERVVSGYQGNSWKPGMTEGFNLRGQEVLLEVLWTMSVYSPFYVSSGGYGVYVQSNWPGVYRFGIDRNRAAAPQKVTLEYEGPGLTLHVIPGPLPLNVTQRYSGIIGRTIMPPRWTFGPWRWRDDVFDLAEFYDGTTYKGPYNSMIVEDILMMEALGIPCSLYWVDRPWARGDFGYDDFEWDETRLPEALAMIDWLESKGTKFMLWIAPWAMGKMATEAEKKGYTVTNPIPAPPAEARLIDLTIPEAVTWWQDAMIPRINEGVVGFKLDRGEEKVPDGKLFSGFYADGTSYREGHNAFPLWYARSVNGAYRRAGVEEFVVMPRAAWAGSQQYAIFWGGDTWGSSYGLRSAIIAVQRSAAMNFPIWGSDTCGYDPVAPREVCARWLAFSAFTPLMEVGPTGNYSLWSMPPEGVEGNVTKDGYDFEPQYDEELVAIWIFYARLHNDLMDYSYRQAEEAHRNGTPIVRPMIFMYPEVSAYNDLFEQYFYGPDLLVAPVWQEGLSRKTLQIPPDGVWLDAWTGQSVQAGSTVTVDVPSHKIPIFIRHGVDIGLGDLNERWAQAQQQARNKPDLAQLVKTMR